MSKLELSCGTQAQIYLLTSEISMAMKLSCTYETSMKLLALRFPWLLRVGCDTYEMPPAMFRWLVPLFY
jgi:hypothetical protein